MSTYKHIAIIRKLDNQVSDAVQSVVGDIVRWADDAGIECNVFDPTNYEDEDWIPPTKDTLFVAIGGDGTIIYASKLAMRYEAHAIGFNLGKVGFLADFPPTNVRETLDLVQRDALDIEERSVAATSLIINGKVEQFLAFNEFVISAEKSDTMFKYDMYAGSKFAGSHIANGVICSTATGSTAYAMNVGGALILPDLDVLEVAPIAPQTMTSRPLIGQGMAGFTFKFKPTNDKPIVLRADGQVVATFNGDQSDENRFVNVSIRTIDRRVQLLHHPSWNYFDVLTEKLSWNK